MKICFLLPLNGRSGGLFTVYEHAKRFRDRGHEVTLLFQDDLSSTRIDTYPGMKDIPTARLSELKPSVTFDYAIATWWETVFAIHQIPARRYGYYVQGFEKTFYEAPYRAFGLLVEKTYLEDLDLFTVSKALQKYVEEFGRRAVVIPNSINFEPFFKAEPAFPKTERLRILVEGPPETHYKRIPETFEILSGFPQVEVFYVSAAGKPRPNWKIDRFFEGVPYEQMPGIYASCDIVLKLSSVESFALPVLEMFAAGGTAIVTAFPGHDEYIRDNENALVVPLDKPHAAGPALQRLLSDRELLSRLRNNARQTCRTFVTWEESNAIFENGIVESQKKPNSTFGQTTNKYRTEYQDLKRLAECYPLGAEADARIQAIYRTPAWRAGRVMTWPVRFIRDYLKGFR